MIYFITGNQKKFNEMKALMPDIEQLDIDLPEIQALDPREIIKAKLQAALQHKSGGFIVEDTSFTLDCLNGLPGTLIKWFMETIGSKGLANIAEKFGNDRAAGRAMIGFAKNPEEIEFFEGVIQGRVVQPRGNTGYGWDTIFIPEGFEQTFAEMGMEEKQKVSHRGKAVEKLQKYLLQQN